MVSCARTRFMSCQPQTLHTGSRSSEDLRICTAGKPNASAFATSLLIARAGIFGPLAVAARMRLQLEAEILRFGFGGLLELEDQIVAVALGNPGLADPHVALLLELDVGFAVLGVG